MHHVLQLLGHIAIGAAYFFLGANLMFNWNKYLADFNKRNIPYANIVFFSLLGLQMLFGISLIFHFVVKVISICLILLTFILMYFFFPFWNPNLEDRKMRALCALCHLGLIGGLLLILSEI